MTSAVIFTSLSLFQLLRTPLQLLRAYTFALVTAPCASHINFIHTILLFFTAVALSGITDAYNAVNRMYEVFIAETVDETRLTDPSLSVALEVKDAEFTWDGAPPSEDSPKKKRKRKHGRLSVAATRTFTNADVFKLRELNLSVPRGQLCAIVGPVGSGKSSLLQGLMGEMRRTSGTVTFCGSVSYCPQGAWIQVECIGLPQCHAQGGSLPHSLSCRMRQSEKTYVLDDRSSLSVIGKQSGTCVFCLSRSFD